MNFNINHLVALLTVMLSAGIYNVLVKTGTSWKIALGVAVLAIILAGVFWTGVYLGAHDDEDD